VSRGILAGGVSNYKVCESEATQRDIKQLRENDHLQGHRYESDETGDKAPVVFGCHSDTHLRKLILWDRLPLDRSVLGGTAVSHQTVFETSGASLTLSLKWEDFLSTVKAESQPKWYPVKVGVKILDDKADYSMERCICIDENAKNILANRGWYRFDRVEVCQTAKFVEGDHCPL
jgi:hypothetical protein